MNRSTYQEFWEHQHQQSNNQWLTGTGLEAILKFYTLTPGDFAGQTCLEIGVGLATVTESLSKLCKILYCADISDHALERSKPYAAGTWLTGDISSIPPVDIAICHLVFVHCDEQESLRILRAINLKPDGKIFCQFSCLKNADALSTASPRVKELLIGSGMHFFRTEEEIDQIIHEAGLYQIKATAHDPGSYHGWHGQYWQFYHLAKKPK